MLRKTLRITGKVILYGFLFSIFMVLLYRFVPPPFTFLMIQRTFEQSVADKPVQITRSWKPAKKISDHLKKAVIAAEDQRFTQHNGFDFEAIEKAYERNKKGKRVRGASTISQQVAKNVFLWPARSWLRKGFEVYFTFLIELLWSKERILEVYLNVAELGDGIYGAEAASQKYFHKPAAKLTKYEAAALAAILPNPRKWSAIKPGPYVGRRQQWILKNMGRMGPLEL